MNYPKSQPFQVFTEFFLLKLPLLLNDIFTIFRSTKISPAMGISHKINTEYFIDFIPTNAILRECGLALVLSYFYLYFIVFSYAIRLRVVQLLNNDVTAAVCSVLL